MFLRILAVMLALVASGPALAEPWTLERSEIRTVAASNGVSYRMLVAWPQGDPPAKGWPVLWVLDGEDNFAIAALSARRLSAASARTGVEPGVVVGVDSGSLAQRVRDYTPPAPGYTIPTGLPAAGLATGGAETFLDIIDRELRPALAERIRIDRNRQTLAGHSFGGLLALHALATGREYAGYAAISPSLWFGGADLALRRGGAAPVLLAGNTLERVAGEGDAVADLAQRWQSEGRRAAYLPLPGQTHGTSMLAAMGAIVDAAFGRSK